MSSIKKVALVAVFLVMKQLVIAQAPWVFPFQAVARYPNSGVIANKAIKVRFTIKDASSTGTTVYQETQSPTTSALGLFSVNIGSGGTSVTGTISTLTWGTSLKFLQVEMDTTNAGTSYVSLGTQQLLSVPYALTASSVGALTASGTNIGIGTTTPTNKLSVEGSANFTGNIGIGTTNASYPLDIENINNSGITHHSSDWSSFFEDYLYPSGVTLYASPSLRFSSSRIAANGNIITLNPNTVAINATATAAASDILTGYITSVSAAAFNLTLPTASQLATELMLLTNSGTETITAGTKINFEIDNSANTKIVTVVVNTGITAGTAVITGSTTLAVAAGAVGGFRLIFTSGTTAKLFRMY